MFLFLGQDVRLQINCLEAYFESRVFDCEDMEKGRNGLELSESLVAVYVEVGWFCLGSFFMGLCFGFLCSFVLLF